MMCLKKTITRCFLITLSLIGGLLPYQTLRAQKSIATPVVTGSISDFIKNLKSYPGYFNFYYDEKNDKIYLEIDKLGTEFLYYTSLTDGVGSGGPERGQATAVIAKFIQVGQKILLVEPNYAYRAITDNKDEQKAVENAFAQSVIWSFKVLAVGQGKVLIDLSPFLVRDSQKIASSIGSNNLPGLHI